MFIYIYYTCRGFIPHIYIIAFGCLAKTFDQTRAAIQMTHTNAHGNMIDAILNEKYSM